MSMRAAIRAHVGATRAAGMKRTRDAAGKAAVITQSHSYLVLADRLLQPRPARLIAIGGLSGSGKSTAAAAIAEEVGAPPGARVLSSDRLRKQHYGVAPQTRLPPQAYDASVSARIYAVLRERTAAALAVGHSVIVDAVFDRPEDRNLVEALAREAGVTFQGFWLEAPAAVLLERVEKRRGDPSDADAAVLRGQLQRDIGPLAWRRVDAAGLPGRTMLQGLLP
jgi:predicted kinase